jgi:hypothetical protein
LYNLTAIPHHRLKGALYYKPMTDSLGDLLKHKQRPEPPEFVAIKDYIFKKFKATVSVSLQNDQLVITASSAALAGTLRMEIISLQELIGTKQRIQIRIG